MHIVMLIAYNGTNYQGSQWQEHGNTIENTLYEIFKKTRHITDKTFKFHSRTDKQVSATMNLLIGEFIKWPNIQKLNKLLLPTKIQIHAAYQVKNEQKPVIKDKTYVYYLAKQGRYKHTTTITWNEVVQKVQGFYEIEDFTAFIKEDKYPRNKNFKITKITIKEHKHGWILGFTGNGFGWQQVRRMVGFLFDKKYQADNPSEYKKEIQPLPIQVPQGNTLLLARTTFQLKKEKCETTLFTPQQIHELIQGVPYGFHQLFYQELSHTSKIIHSTCHENDTIWKEDHAKK